MRKFDITLDPAHKFSCNVCEDDKWIRHPETDRLTRCGCVYGDSYSKNLSMLQTFIKPQSDDLNIQLMQPIGRQSAVLKKWNGLWLCGETGTGKSMCAALYVRKHLNHSRENSVHFDWKWLGHRDVLRDFDTENRHGIPASYAYDMIVFDDIDKIGNITESRYEYFFQMLEDLARNNVKCVFTSNVSMQVFCARFPVEVDQRNAEGVGPMERRFRDVLKCAEVML